MTSFIILVLTIHLNFSFYCRVSSYSFSLCCETNGSVGANVFLFFFTVKWLTTAVHECHIAVSSVTWQPWLSHNCHMTATWLSWLSHDCRMTVTWLSWLSQLSHDCRMTVLWMYDVYWCTCTIVFEQLISISSIDSHAALWGEEELLSTETNSGTCTSMNLIIHKSFTVMWTLC